MKLFICAMAIFFMSLSFAERYPLKPDQSVEIQPRFWGNSFFQKGKKIKVMSLFGNLSSYQSSEQPIAKARAYYFPAWIATGAGTLVMVIPVANAALGENFPLPMFLGGVGLVAIGAGLFKVSNMHMTDAVKKYNHEINVGPTSKWELKLKLVPNYKSPGLIAQLRF